MTKPFLEMLPCSNGRRRGSSIVAFIAVLGIGVVAAIGSPAGADGGKRLVPAHAARTLNIADTAHLHLVKASGSMLDETGSVSGTLPGSMGANLDVGATFSGNFTIHTSGGTIKGHGIASSHGSGRYESFGGSMVVTGGSGRYAHVQGHGRLYGTFDRRLFAFVVQTTGKLSY